MTRLVTKAALVAALMCGVSSAAFALLHEPPSLALGETTDKAYINQRAVLANRAAVVNDLYAEGPSELIGVVNR